MASARRVLIAANWKMNGLRADGLPLARAVVAHVGAGRGAEVLICPPATLIAPVAEIVRGTPVALGGQDCHAEPAGAFTGDIAAPMLGDAGCSHVILGHSERRSLHHETSDAVRAKAEAALAARLVPLVCVGETESERDAGNAHAVVDAQLRDSIPPTAEPGTLVVAYEPIWAIGTGRTPGEADVDAMHRHIRSVLGELLPRGEQVRILYGGSVKPANAAQLLAIPDVDGALVGGASLVAADFAAIVEAAPAR